MMLSELKYEELKEGADLPVVKKGPITRQQLVDYASASGDYNKLHYDESFAKNAGLEGCIAHGMLIMALVGSYVRNWARGRTIQKLGVQFRGMTKEGDQVLLYGRIEKKYREKDENLIEVSLVSKTQEEVVTTTGSAIIAF